MARPLRAGMARRGDTLRKHFLHSELQHLVITTEFTSPSTVKVTTTQGAWEFGVNEELLFPRRVDGSTCDWANDEVQAKDLYPGDTLPGRDGTDDFRQTVTSVSAPNRMVIRIGASSDISNVARFDFNPNETVAFPHKEHASSTPKVLKQSELQVFGPYKDVEDIWLWFALHPGGRGRWPRYFGRLSNGRIGFWATPTSQVVRPPAIDEAWPLFYGEPQDRHPHDHGTIVQSRPDVNAPTVGEIQKALRNGNDSTR